MKIKDTLNLTIMKSVSVFLIISFLLILQLSFFPSLSIAHSFANLVLIFVIIRALLGNLEETVWTALFAGVLLDFFSGTPDGLLTLSLLMSTVGTYFIARGFISSQRWILFVFGSVLVGSVLFILSFLIINWMFGFINLSVVINYPQLLRQKIWLDLLWNLLFAFPIFLLVQKFDRLVIKYSST